MSTRQGVHADARGRGHRRTALRLSARAYFSWVAAATAAVFLVALLFDPVLAFTVREMVGLEKPAQAAPDSFYAMRVAPLFDARCVSCHGERRQKGQLRLDSFAGIKRGGRHGGSVQPGKPADSELIARIKLPPSDDKAMPPDGKTPFTADEIKIIELWVEAGASGTTPVAKIKGAPKPRVHVMFEEFDVQEVARQRAPFVGLVGQLKNKYPGVVEFQSRGSADVEVNASWLGARFGDNDIAAFAPLGARVIRADLSGTAITDVSADALASMQRLHILRLANTKITDATIEKLASLQSLRSLSVIGTAVTNESLAPLRENGVKIYAEVNVPRSVQGPAHE